MPVSSARVVSSRGTSGSASLDAQLLELQFKKSKLVAELKSSEPAKDAKRVAAIKAQIKRIDEQIRRIKDAMEEEKAAARADAQAPPRYDRFDRRNDPAT